jgi:TonB family protein
MSYRAGLIEWSRGLKGEFMRNLSVIALFVLLITRFSAGQQTAAPVPTTPETAKPAQSINVPKIYMAGPGVTAPELLPLDVGPFSSEKCKYASKIVEADRFKPGIHDGARVTVRECLEVNMHTCVEQTEEEAVNKTYRLRLRSQPEQKFRAFPRPEEPLKFDKAYAPPTSIDGVPVYRVGNGVSVPEPQNTVEAEFSDEARRAKFQGVCVISVIIDTEGKPRNLHVVRELGMGLDEKAMEAVSQYRFKPAMKDGVPVPVSIQIEIVFRLY